ncbi:hypothetical protein BJ138DRAFT_1126854 [Hygrophoropsis aurantiaca]|uniref:Uncharacterized protein n=1 Tax=Hygrophoropsis aurantiaca TaxID=72124 RepID=A0ACB8ABG9_9AGAM|nr:hypothetical protein BJ138DRAFT_1126854 [Hygrophoropsis aurantiaca]
MKNSFEAVNRVRCFNHTLQLAAKALLKPFTSALSKDIGDGTTEDTGDCPPLILDDDTDFDDDTEHGDDIEDNIDELAELDPADRQQLLVDTANVKTTIAKIRGLSFAIIRSTTILLPAWRRMCVTEDLKPNLIPRDVATRWNSTYDMLEFALKYRAPIDVITSDKTTKQAKKYELDDDDWKIVVDLVAVLKVGASTSGRCQLVS